MARPTRIAELAAKIAQETAEVDEYRSAKGLPSPSFDANGPVDLTVESSETEVARMSAISACLELSDLLQGPVSCLRPAVSICFPIPHSQLTVAADKRHEPRSNLSMEYSIPCSTHRRNFLQRFGRKVWFVRTDLAPNREICYCLSPRVPRTASRPRCSLGSVSSTGG